MTLHHEAIVIGVSAGGLTALSTIVPSLPEGFPLPVTVVQHRRPNSDGFLAAHLNERSPLPVKEVDDKEPIRPGVVYLAPADYHVLIEEDGTFSLSVDERVRYSRPSIDVLFHSAADVYADKTIGVILTGANADGSEGLKHIKQRGGLAIVQDPATAEAECMPQEAINATRVDRILRLEDIGPFLVESCPGSATYQTPAMRH